MEFNQTQKDCLWRASGKMSLEGGMHPEIMEEGT